jgi:hypothetical protein
MKRAWIAVVLACGLGVGVSRAQVPSCIDWLSMPFAAGSLPQGADNAINAFTEFDFNGGGTPWLVAAGDFTTIEGVAANRVAVRDPATGKWQPLGAGTDGSIRCLAIFNGQLYAGGLFTHADGQVANHIARWDGSAWQPVGGGANNDVYALSTFNSQLIAGGFFTSIGAVGAAHIAAWNGTVWSAIGTGTNDWVIALGQYNGELIAGGYFTIAGGFVCNRIARWNGTNWLPLGSGMNQEVVCLGSYSGGLVAGGRFTTAGGLTVNRIARWTGNAWTPIGTGADNIVIGLSNFNGDLIAGGSFLDMGGVTVAGIARWNGSSWQALEFGLIGAAYAMWDYGDELTVGGSFSEAGAMQSTNLARWNGTKWCSYGGGSGYDVLCMTQFYGLTAAGGDFHQSCPTGHAAHYVIGWNGVRFWSYGKGMDKSVYALKGFKYPGFFGNNELIAGGQFTVADGNAANHIARYVVTPIIGAVPAWSAMGAGLDNIVRAIERHSDVTYAGGDFISSGSTTLNRIARWNESSDTWEALGTGMNGPVYALRSFGGLLYAGGAFTTAGGVSTGGLARWNGTAWTTVAGYFTGTVYALEIHNGQLVIGGSFPSVPNSPNIEAFNGVFFPFGTGTNGPVRALTSTGSRLYIGGDFSSASGVPVTRVAYWDGTWHDVAGGASDVVYALTNVSGEVHAGGAFTSMHGGSVYSPRWSRYSETGVPWIVQQPYDATTHAGGTVSFTAKPAAGYVGLSYQWYHSGVAMSDGPTENASTISGAHTTTLTIAGASQADQGNYSMIVSSPCGNDTSTTATLTMTWSAAVPGLELPGVALFEALGPNPARGDARLTFTLARAAEVRFVVHDIAGRKVRQVDAGRLPAGRHQRTWDSRDQAGQPVTSGLYLVSLEVDGRRLGARRLAVIR